MDPISQNTKTKMQEALNILHQDFNTVRTGKANPALVENIMINAYGGTAKLKVLELATIHAIDTQTLVITPFDRSVLNEIVNGLTNSQANLSPIVDSEVIRIVIPPLTEERRRDFVKMINQKTEQGKVMLRQIRHESIDEIKKADDAGGVSEDEVERLEKEIQRLTDEFVKKMEVMRDEKEQELMRM